MSFSRETKAAARLSIAVARYCIDSRTVHDDTPGSWVRRLFRDRHASESCLRHRNESNAHMTFDDQLSPARKKTIQRRSSKRHTAGRSLRRSAIELQDAILMLDRKMRRSSLSNGDSTVELQIMQLVDSHPGISQAELAVVEQVSRPTISAHIKKLVERRHIKRSSNGSEQLGKEVPLYLTRAGQAFLRRSISPQQDWLTRRLDALDAQHRRDLIRASRSLKAVLEVSSLAA